MKVGIVGYAGAGKTTVFRWLTGVTPDPAKVAQQGQVGMARVPDDRLDWLSDLFSPKKTTHATIEFLDTPGLMPTERRDNPRRLGILRNSDGLLVVLDGYSGADVAAQLANFQQEIIFADLEIVTNRIAKLEDQIKKPRPQKEKDIQIAEMELLRRINKHYEDGKPPSELKLKAEEEELIRSFQLLTLKPEFVFVNAGEEALKKDFSGLAPKMMRASPKLEMELQELGEEDRAMFMADMGVTEFHREAALREITEAMGVIVFFTVGEDECRAWPMPKGGDAVLGASQIHTDLGKRFVRAEVVAYDDFRRVGSMKEAKSQGVHRLEGKTYVVKDGDIMHIL